jgi:hypothetical protein
LNQVFHISTGKSYSPKEGSLSIRVGERHFGFSISFNDPEELIQLTWYVGKDNERLELDEVYSRHPELKNEFKNTAIGFDHPYSLLVPLINFEDRDPEIFLRTMYGSNGEFVVNREDVPGWQLQNVYAIPADINEWTRRHFPAGLFLHNYSVGIRQIGKTGGEESLLIDFRSSDFSLVASKGGRLLLAQTVAYSNPADVIYYLVKVCKEFGFSRETANLIISGLVEKNSNLYRELEHYFLSIRFRQPSWQVEADTEQTYPAHFFTSLNDLTLCAS